MSEMEKFSRNVLNELVFKVGTDEFVVKPSVGAKANLLKGIAKSGEDSEKRIEFLQNFMIELFHKDNQSVPKETIERFVSDNINVLMDQMMIGFKIIDAKDLEDKKKELSQLINK